MHFYCLLNKIPKFIEREEKIKPFISREFGEYVNLLNESKEVYKLGYFYSAVAMIGICAEKFSIELASQSTSINNDIKQYQRLRKLRDEAIINQDSFEKLDKIRDIRNSYIHLDSNLYPESDSEVMINLMIDILSQRFSEKYIIKEGKIVKL